VVSTDYVWFGRPKLNYVPLVSEVTFYYNDILLASELEFAFVIRGSVDY